MIFCYHPQSGEKTLEVSDETHHYLTRVKRHKINDTIDFRNLLDKNLYQYSIQNIYKNHSIFKLKNTKNTKHVLESNLENSVNFSVHLVWAKINPQIIYKTLPFLNELDLKHLTILETDRSQGNFKIDLEKCKKILINSCQQSGRTDLMGISEEKNLANFLQKNPHTITLHTNAKKTLCPKKMVENFLEKKDASGAPPELPFLIGPEGGFSPEEEKILENYPVYRLPHPLILRSETAAIFVAGLKMMT